MICCEKWPKSGRFSQFLFTDEYTGLSANSFTFNVPLLWNGAPGRVGVGVDAWIWHIGRQLSKSRDTAMMPDRRSLACKGTDCDSAVLSLRRVLCR
jgi:hypothetical protein